MNTSQEYRSIFSEILSCSTLANHSFFRTIYIKHFSYIESSEAEIKYFEFLDKAKESGLSTYKKREAEIINEGSWSKADESKLNDEESFIKNLQDNISKDFLQSRRDRLKKEIEESIKRCDALRIKKDFYIGKTAEQWANKKLTLYKVLNSFFKDKLLSTPLMLEDEEEIEGNNYDELIFIYNNYQNRFSFDNIKKIVISPFFTNIFNLAQDNIYNFYGKPIVNLTEHQSNLVLYGGYFKRILGEYSKSVPLDIKDDPDRLIEWVEIMQNARERGIIGEDSEEEGGTSIIGASVDDYRLLGINISTKNPLSEALKKKGGSLSKEDLINL